MFSIRSWSLAAGLTFAVGCASSQQGTSEQSATATSRPTATTAQSAAVDPQTMKTECETLIGSINAGIAHVGQMEQSATSSGQDQFATTASALDSVARAIEERSFYSSDLQRLGGFYVGIAKAQASTLREMSAASAKGDTAAMNKALTNFEALGQQEDIVVEELNQKCGPYTAQAAPTASAPSK
ncbi:MAG: hypothetical protein U0271_24270 [Polyangiaceae bacterium]